LVTVQADSNGGFIKASGFVVPFGLRGKQTLIFIGEKSRAPTTASFDTLPYTPSVQPSTYGGRPGTTLAFYATGFARQEVVHAFVGRTQASQGHEVSCFLTDAQGNAAAAGSYVVPGDAQAGQLVFALVGNKSQATATMAMEVIASEIPVQMPAQPEFACSLDDGSATGSVSVSQVSATPVSDGASASAGPVAATGPTDTDRTYTSQPGDTLPSIAQKEYGDSNLWHLLFDANKAIIGDNPSVLKVGTELKIPPPR
jgi:hypothetical protein